MSGKILPISTSYTLTPEDMEIIKNITSRRFQEIMSNGQTMGRDEKAIFNNILFGNKIEYGVAKMFKGSTQNDKDFDVSDKYSYNHDIITEDGKLIEVKSLSEDKEWLNFNLKTAYEQDFHRILPFYDTFINNSQLIDYLVTARIYDNTVKIKHFIDSKTFTHYIRKSRKIPYGSTHYYDVKRAILSGNCRIFN